MRFEKKGSGAILWIGDEAREGKQRRPRLLDVRAAEAAGRVQRPQPEQQVPGASGATGAASRLERPLSTWQQYTAERERRHDDRSARSPRPHVRERPA